MQKLPHVFIVIVVLIASLAASRPAQAMAQLAECSSLLGLNWQETGSNAFTILFPQEYALIGRRLGASQKKAVLDQEYHRMEVLFGISLALPISIRVYPDVEAYACLNANADQLQAGALHASSGGREIALIGSDILENYAAWDESDVNFIRYELSMLFARQAAGDNAPAGLGPALARYLQDPAQTIGLLQLQWIDWTTPKHTWRSLWEEDPPSHNLGRQMEAASTVAFLVDVYGWDDFLTFLGRISSAPNFNMALSETYQANLPELEAGWRAYYPGYFQGGWRYHLLHNYDLSLFETLLAQEKYAEADARLLEAIDFLSRMGDARNLKQARRLLLRARSGQQAESLLGQSQQAYQAGDFSRALAHLAQAEQKYEQAGASYYHLDEIAAQRNQVAQAQALRIEIDMLEADAGSGWNTFALAGQTLTLGRRVGRLGDLDGYHRVQQVARTLEARQRGQYQIIAAVIAVFILALLALLVRLARRSPPPEARL